MAKKTMTLAYEQMVTYRRRNVDGDVSYTEYTERARVMAQGSSRGTDHERVWCDFKPLWDAAVTVSNVRSVEMTAGLTADKYNTGKMTVKFVAGNNLGVGVTHEDFMYEQCVSGDAIGTAEISAGGTATKTLTLSGNALADFLAHKAIGIAAQTEAEEGDGTTLIAEVNAISVTIEYANESAAPAISIDTISQAASKELLYSYTDSITIGWSYSQEAGMSQSRIDVQIRSDAGDWTALENGYFTSAQSYTISPQNFPAPYAKSGVMRVRVRAYSSSGAVSGWAEVRLAMVFPEAYQLSPGGGSIVMADSAAVLSWAARTEYDGVELSNASAPDTFDLAYSDDGGETWTELQTGYASAASSGRYSYTVNAGMFPTGVVLWRVRPRVKGNALDSWAQESVVVRAQAVTTEDITCDGLPIPTIIWYGTTHIAYRVRFADYDSGIVVSAGTADAENRHIVPYLYEDGVYPVQIKTQIADGTWSEWSSVYYAAIKNGTATGLLVSFTAQKTGNAVKLKWVGSGSWTFVLHRNGKQIYAGTATQFTDVGAVGECVYKLYAVSSARKYKSLSATVNADPATDCMYDMTTEAWIPLVYSSSARSRSYSETAGVVYKRYTGREYPVAFTDGAKERQLNVSYCFKSKADADAVRAAIGHTVIYKDTMGGRIVGILTGMTETVTRRYEHQLTIVQVDYEEEVPYEA